MCNIENVTENIMDKDKPDYEQYKRILDQLLKLTKDCKNNCLHDGCKNYSLCDSLQDKLWMMEFGDL